MIPERWRGIYEACNGGSAWDMDAGYLSKLISELGAVEAALSEARKHQVTFAMEDSLMEADFLRSQFEALGIVIETSVEETAPGRRITTRTTINKRADDAERQVAQQAATIAELSKALGEAFETTCKLLPKEQP